MYVHWVDEKQTVIQIDFTPPPETWDDYHQAIREVAALASSVQYPVIIIHNAGDTPMLSGNFIGELLNAARILPDNIAGVASVVTNGLARRTIRTMLSIYNQFERFAIVETLDEAYDFAFSEVTSS